MEDLRQVKITEELVEKLGLKFTDRNMNLLNYEALTLESDGGILRVCKGGEELVLTPCKKKTEDGFEIDDVERKIVSNYVERTFKRNDMTGVYVEY